VFHFHGGPNPKRDVSDEPQLDINAAIVHDWFVGMYGAERVVEAMWSGLFVPSARPDIFTFHAVPNVLPPDMAASIVRESHLASLPGLRQGGLHGGRWRYLLPYFPHYFANLDLEPYDLVISSSHACAFHVRTRLDSPHVCYCHTPLRYVWTPEVDGHRVGAPSFALRVAGPGLRRADRAAAARPDVFVANSNAVRDRIQRFYGRDAVVVHPPVNVDEFEPSVAKDPGQFLWAGRLVPYKRPDLVIQAFRGLPYRLVMVGVGPLERQLRRNLPENVRLLGWSSRQDLVQLYGESSGFIHVGEEDFGMTMVEALASGTPVVGLARGGAVDIVRPGQDGVLVDHPEPALIREAVDRVAQTRWDPAALVDRARLFSRPHFLRRMREVILGVSPD
jgi:glycosyltransferase involved in cell wall biosynthesis